MIGSVKWFDSKKGFGFIESPGLSDLFVHFSEIQSENYKKLYPGEYVEFELNHDSEKPSCLNVTGPNGGKLLIQNEKYRYKIYPINKSSEDLVDDSETTETTTENTE